MQFDKELLDSVLSYIGERLNHEVEGLLIGGNAMIYYGLRGQTKDSDLVFFDRRDLTGVIQIILSHPIFRKGRIMKELPYKINPELLKKGEPTVVGNKDIPRFDLFYKFVFGVDAKRIFESASRSIRFGLLKLRIAEIEHLIFLKAVSARPVDLDDIVRICKELKIDWKVFTDFTKSYHKIDARPVWFALGSLYDVNKKEKVIPSDVIRKIQNLF